jgi:hypothetical protein
MKRFPAQGSGAVMVVLLAATLSLVVGCGAGQRAATSQQSTTASGGVNGNVGDLALRDAQFVWQPPVQGDEVYSIGQDSPLQLTIVNTGGAPDRFRPSSGGYGTRVSEAR